MVSEYRLGIIKGFTKSLSMNIYKDEKIADRVNKYLTWLMVQKVRARNKHGNGEFRFIIPHGNYMFFLKKYDNIEYLKEKGLINDLLRASNVKRDKHGNVKSMELMLDKTIFDYTHIDTIMIKKKIDGEFVNLGY